ncbi:MAG: CCA tRNA nucleotidyltransferase [Candidatus Nanoarchaeia archaeon]|jgi:tRNA nucleotidyltransferase (CCA-adding enzyme)|nr:CCA tRNA nucleotidyltransferase [Candidatus Nanoarchaeia archaeon]|tara:strand:+ start:84055 stop:85263 length:1209 start_codon:yes stop_codon:yes gene_type:complete
MNKLLDEVLKKIKPSKEEISKVNIILDNIVNKIKISKAKVELGGSGAKDTWLSNTNDIDVYVKFDFKNYNNKDISSILEKSLKNNFKIIRLHGSRDYFQLKQKGFTIEVIPILNIKKVSEAKNITDISPFHVKFVKKHKKGDQIRLVKSFCKAQDCYGAESYIRGFSGYVLEILTVKYGNFNSFIKNVSKWKDKQYIGNKDLIKKLNKSKKESPLILIDPVDPNRNAASALNIENYNKLIKASKSYIKKPSIKHFEKKEFSLDLLKNKYKNKKLVILEVDPLKGKKDVVGAKLLKTLNYIAMKLKSNDFKLSKYDWAWNEKAIFYYILDKKSLSKNKEHKGPPIKNIVAIENFRKKWKNYKIKNKYAYVIIKRKFIDPEKFIKYLIKNDKHIKDMVKLVKFK